MTYKTCHSTNSIIATHKSIDFYAGCSTEADDWCYVKDHLNIRLNRLYKATEPLDVVTSKDIDLTKYFMQTHINGHLEPSPTLLFNWEDGGVLHFNRTMWKEFYQELFAYCKGEKLKTVYTHCIGGHGRTGTFYAIMLGWFNLVKGDPVLYLRKHYCKEAVETHGQLEYIEYILERPVTQKLPEKTYVTPAYNSTYQSTPAYGQKYFVAGLGWYSTKTGSFLHKEAAEATRMLEKEEANGTLKPVESQLRREFDAKDPRSQNEYLEVLQRKVQKNGIMSLTDDEYEIYESETSIL